MPPFFGVVAGVAVEAVLEGGGGIAQLAFAHDCALFEIEVAEGLVANLVGDLQPDATIVFRLTHTERQYGFIDCHANGIEIAAERLCAPLRKCRLGVRFAVLLACVRTRAWYDN